MCSTCARSAGLVCICRRFVQSVLVKHSDCTRDRTVIALRGRVATLSTALRRSLQIVEAAVARRANRAPEGSNREQPVSVYKAAGASDQRIRARTNDSPAPVRDDRNTTPGANPTILVAPGICTRSNSSPFRFTRSNTGAKSPASLRRSWSQRLPSASTLADPATKGEAWSGSSDGPGTAATIARRITPRAVVRNRMTNLVAREAGCRGAPRRQ